MNTNLDELDTVTSRNEIKSCKYYTSHEFLSAFELMCDSNCNPSKMSNINNSFQDKTSNSFSLLHINSRSINKNFDSVENFLDSLNRFSFSVIGISETWLKSTSPDTFNIANYHMIHADRKKGRGGGVAMYINFQLKYKIRKDIYIDGIENLFIEIDNKYGKNIIVGTLYRPPSNNINNFIDKLDEELDKMSRENKHIYIMGDFNIDLSKSLQSTPPHSILLNGNYSIDHNTNAFLNILSSYGFYPNINVPTRITPMSETLIDNIFSNSYNKDNNSGVFTYDVTDHLPIFLISSQLKVNNIKEFIKQSYRKEDINTVSALNEDLANEEWHDILEENNVNIAYENFIHKLTHYYNKNIPLVQRKRHKNKIKNPWITVGILRSIKKRNKLYKSYISNPSESNFDRYKKYRNSLNGTIRTSKQMYFSNELEKAEGNLNATWNTINRMINKNKPGNNPDNLKINDKEITNPAEIAQAFNSFFTNIGPELASKISCNNKHFTEYLSKPNDNTMCFIPTDQHEILKIVKFLKPKKSTGHDGISTKLLKQIIPNIVLPLEHIFNLSLSTGCCPDLLKLAKVIPIFKKDDPTQVTNYRPISLLPCISKILEKIVYKRLDSFLSLNKILNSAQFGFRKKFSTNFAINKLLDSVINSLSKKDHIIAIFMDLSKAFDTIDHNILLHKLYNYGIRGVVWSWIKSYLSNRQQYVSVDDANSPISINNCGVPQGSILGPLLFLIYINDIINSSPILSFVLFADDTNILLSHKNLIELINIMNLELINVSSWFKCNKLSLNISKTHFMHFQTTRRDVALPQNIIIDNLPLNPKDHVKFLGITIDKHLSWGHHVNNVSSSIAKGIGILYRLKHFLPERSLLMLYNALILPYLNYCNITWGNCSKTKLDHIFLLQKKAVRICTKSPYLSHTDPLFKRLRSLKIYDINTLQIAIFMFKYNYQMLPTVFTDFFSYNNNLHSYPTRTCNNIHLDNPRILLAQKALRHHGPDIWNTLPNFLKQITTLTSFKRSLKEMLLKQYNEN